MKCSQAEVLLQLAADGELTPDEANAFEKHLNECVSCRRKEAWFELLEEELEPVFRSTTTESLELADKVVAALHQKAPQGDSTRQTVPVRSKKKKAGLLARVAKAAFRRVLGPVPKIKKPTRNATWVNASLRALQPPPASLEGFRAMGNAVTGPVEGVRSALGRRSRRSGS